MPENLIRPGAFKTGHGLLKKLEITAVWAFAKVQRSVEYTTNYSIS